MLSDVNEQCVRMQKEVSEVTEVNTRSPGQALTLLSEGGPRSVPRVLSEI